LQDEQDRLHDEQDILQMELDRLQRECIGVMILRQAISTTRTRAIVRVGP
jgi:hypothetical protein